MKRYASVRVIAFLLLVSMTLPALAAGRIGLGFSIKTAGLFSTTLEQVSVAKVVADSPAEKAGLKVGDEIVEINGTPIHGASGLKMRQMLADAKPGDHLAMEVKRGEGDLKKLDLIVGE